MTKVVVALGIAGSSRDWVASGTQLPVALDVGADRGTYVAERARRRAGDHRGGGRRYDDLGLVELLAVVGVAVLLEVVAEIGGREVRFVVGTGHHLDDLAAAVGQAGPARRSGHRRHRAPGW